MAKLKLGAIADDKPVKLTVELPAAVHRDLLTYAKALACETGQPIADPSKLVAPILARFMATAISQTVGRLTSSTQSTRSGRPLNYRAERQSSGHRDKRGICWR